jgi:penicillin-binding protein 2
MAREGLRYQTFSRRALILAGVQGAAVTALAGRLYFLTVVNGEQYRLRADKNRISTRLVVPERGEILDRNDVKLAVNRPDFTVYLIPEQAGDISKILARLARIVKLDARKIARVKRQIRRQRSFLPVTVAQGLDWRTFSKVNVEMPNLPGVLTNAGLSRFYPDGRDIAHIVGYLARPNEDDIALNRMYRLPGFKVGRQGVERRFEDTLRGQAGTRRVEVNAVGREIRELPPRQEATKGEDLKLTLDMRLQKFALEQLGEEAAGSVAIDIKTGEVLALASTPTYDPNEFTAGISQENWDGLLNDPRKPLMNKCLTGQYPPGSTIKMLVALAALEQGIIKPDTEFYCSGKHPLGDHTFHCWKKGGHGMQDLFGGISNSCDVYFYEIAEKLDIDHIAEMAQRFGLGSLADMGVDGVRAGLVPDRAWKRAVLNEPWHLGETLNVSIGQGAMLATPLQLAVMTARLASGLEVYPKIIEDYLSNDQPAFNQLQVNPLHLRTVRRGMEMVMEPKGTAHDLRRSKTALKQAGKTGTAQVRRISREERISGVLDNKDKPWQARDHALFVGYAPAENPRIAVSVLVQHGGGGSSTAAPIGRSLLDKALELLDVSSSNPPTSEEDA